MQRQPSRTRKYTKSPHHPLPPYSLVPNTNMAVPMQSSDTSETLMRCSVFPPTRERTCGIRRRCGVRDIGAWDHRRCSCPRILRDTARCGRFGKVQGVGARPCGIPSRLCDKKRRIWIGLWNLLCPRGVLMSNPIPLKFVYCARFKNKSKRGVIGQQLLSSQHFSQ